jgi:hypothetical protein
VVEGLEEAMILEVVVVQANFYSSVVMLYPVPTP